MTALVTLPRLEELLDRRDEGLLGPEESNELSQLLAADPVCRRALFQHYLFVSEIAHELAQTRVLPQHAPRPRRSLRWGVGGVAVIAVAAVVALVVRKNDAPTWAGARLAAQGPNVSVIRQGRALGQPAELMAGDELVTGHGSRARLGSPAGEIEIGPQSIVALLPAHRLAVVEGDVAVYANEHAAPGDLRLQTDEGVAVLPPGARLLTSVDRGLTVLDVARGPVEWTPTGAARFTLATGQQWSNRPAEPREASHAFALRKDPDSATGKTGDLELARLGQVPMKTMEAALGENAVEGRTGRRPSSVTQLFCTGDRRLALEPIVIGAAVGDPAKVERGLAVADETFALQTAQGNFGDDPGCVAYFVSHLAHAAIVLEKSALGPMFGARIDDVRSGLRRASTFLRDPSNLAFLRWEARRYASRYAFYGVAFAFAGRLLSDPGLEALGAEFVDQALDKQRPDGAFVVAGGHDTSYQGAILWRLSWYQLHFPSDRVNAAMRVGARWLLDRVDAEGRVDVTANSLTRDCAGQPPHCRTVNWVEVSWGLIYVGLLYEPSAVDLAGRVAEVRTARDRAEKQP